MYIQPEFIETLRSRLNIVDIVGKHTSIKRQSNGDYKGCCPFHKEKTPSFSVSAKKGFYHCFGCGVSGDSIKFVMEHLGLPYIEAIKMLASELGMDIPKPTEQQSRKRDKRDILLDIHASTAEFFIQQLHTNQTAQNYLLKRHITPALQQKFMIGYAPNNDSLLKHLQTMFNDDILAQSGIIIKNERGLYSRFRNRIMFPILHNGKVIAFGGRVLGDGEPKYLNSPETDLFHKGNVLYGLDYAKERAYKEDEIFMTEGYMDVIAMHRAGLSNAVATLGTAATEHHLSTLWKITAKPTICLDGDKAGKRAMIRLCERAIPHLAPNRSLEFLNLPDGQDPDDIINNYGTDKLVELCRDTQSISEVIWNEEYNKTPLSTPEERAGLENRLNDITISIEDKNTQYFYRQFFKNKMWENISRNKKISLPNEKLTNIDYNLTIKENIDKEAAHLTTFVIHNPHILEDDDIYYEFESLYAKNDDIIVVRDHIIEIFNDNGKENLIENISDELVKSQVNQLINNEFFTDSEKDISNITQLHLYWQCGYLKYQLATLQEEYKKNDNLEKINLLAKQIIALEAEILSKEEQYIDVVQDI